jgi:hypothetical protein
MSVPVIARDGTRIIFKRDASYVKLKTQNSKPKTQNPEPKTQNPEPKTQNPKPKGGFFDGSFGW